jgi:hypothetical protein
VRKIISAYYLEEEDFFLENKCNCHCFWCNYSHFQPSCVTVLTIYNMLRLDGGVPLTVMDYFYDSSVYLLAVSCVEIPSTFI